MLQRAKSAKGNEHLMTGFKKQSFFPGSIFGITVGTLIEFCCGRDKI